MGGCGWVGGWVTFVHLALGDLGVAQDLLHGLHALAEVVNVEVFKASAGDGGVEVDAWGEVVGWVGGWMV